MNSEDKLILGGAITLAIFLTAFALFDYLKTKESERTKQTIYANWNQFSEIEKKELIKD